ncbi:MAG: hypothetical protein IAC58_03965 [Firmicutes bacterium]|uniref:Lipoprotein n=1 Tax=Candidatus Onthovivens merdipullorum TaxID=2840889 RepID=A0A9D9DI87_9BACL|nr:hypothetical protein [Candidatus Onthovivens merdipullorum]
MLKNIKHKHLLLLIPLSFSLFSCDKETKSSFEEKIEEQITSFIKQGVYFKGELHLKVNLANYTSFPLSYYYDGYITPTIFRNFDDIYLKVDNSIKKLRYSNEGEIVYEDTSISSITSPFTYLSNYEVINDSTSQLFYRPENKLDYLNFVNSFLSIYDNSLDGATLNLDKENNFSIYYPNSKANTLELDLNYIKGYNYNLIGNFTFMPLNEVTLKELKFNESTLVEQALKDYLNKEEYSLKITYTNYSDIFYNLYVYINNKYIYIYDYETKEEFILYSSDNLLYKINKDENNKYIKTNELYINNDTIYLIDSFKMNYFFYYDEFNKDTTSLDIDNTRLNVNSFVTHANGESLNEEKWSLDKIASLNPLFPLDKEYTYDDNPNSLGGDTWNYFKTSNEDRNYSFIKVFTSDLGLSILLDAENLVPIELSTLF